MYDYSDDINQVGKKLNGYIDSSVISTINKAATNNDEIAKNIEKLRDVLKDILQEYKKTEKRICGEDIDREKISDPSKSDTTGEQVWNYILDALWQAFAGDATDTSNALGILLSVGVGFIPIVGQIADLRDLVADIVNLCTDGAETEEWVALGFTLVGIIPGVGDFLKHGDEVASGISKLLKNADNVNEIADAVKGVMKKGSDVYKKAADAVDKALDSDDLIKAYRNAKDVITSRCQKYADKLADATEFTEKVDKSIKSLAKYADKVIDKYVGMAEQYFVNETIDSAENGSEKQYNYAVSGAY